MLKLYEKYRPHRLSQIVGQDRAVAQVGRLAKTGGFAGQAVWISGKSGQGKTTLGLCIAAGLADDLFVQQFDAGRLTPAALQELDRSSHQLAWGKGGRVYIIEEAHGLRKDAVRALLVILEAAPEHVTWIFTTTVDGMSLFEDGIDAGPLLSRCIRIALTSQGLAQTFARLTSRIARREHLDGQDPAAYMVLANRERGNCRAMLQAIQDGGMKERN